MLSAIARLLKPRAPGLVGLPPELRNLIYEEVIATEAEGLKEGLTYLTLGPNGGPAPHPLCQVCRMTRDEFTAMYAAATLSKATSYTARVDDFAFGSIHWLLKRQPNRERGYLRISIHVTRRPAAAERRRLDRWLQLCRAHAGKRHGRRDPHIYQVTCSRRHMSHADVDALVPVAMGEDEYDAWNLSRNLHKAVVKAELEVCGLFGASTAFLIGGLLVLWWIKGADAGEVWLAAVLVLGEHRAWLRYGNQMVRGRYDRPVTGYGTFRV